MHSTKIFIIFLTGNVNIFWALFCRLTLISGFGIFNGVEGANFLADLRGTSGDWQHSTCSRNAVDGIEYSGTVEEDGKLKHDILNLLLKKDLDKEVAELLFRALKEDPSSLVKFRAASPTGMLFHRTLQKIKGPIIKDVRGMMVDSRIKSIPQYGKNVLDLNDLIHLVSYQEPFNDRKSYPVDKYHSKEKMVDLLNAIISKLYNKHVGESDVYGNDIFRKTNLKKRDDSGTKYNGLPKPTKTKTDLVKLILAMYPLQVSFLEGGLLRNYLNRKNDFKNNDPNEWGHISQFKDTPEKRKYRFDNVLQYPEQYFINQSHDILAKNSEGNIIIDDCALVDQLVDREANSMASGLMDKKISNLGQNLNNLNVDKNMGQFFEQNDSKLPANCEVSSTRASVNMNHNIRYNASDSDKDRCAELNALLIPYSSNCENKLKSTSPLPYMRICVKNGPVLVSFQTGVRDNHTVKESLKPVSEPVACLKLSNESASPTPVIPIKSSSLSKDTLTYENFLAKLIDEIAVESDIPGSVKDVKNLVKSTKLWTPISQPPDANYLPSSTKGERYFSNSSKLHKSGKNALTKIGKPSHTPQKIFSGKNAAGLDISFPKVHNRLQMCDGTTSKPRFVTLTKFDPDMCFDQNQANIINQHSVSKNNSQLNSIVTMNPVQRKITSITSTSIQSTDLDPLINQTNNDTDDIEKNIQIFEHPITNFQRTKPEVEPLSLNKSDYNLLLDALNTKQIQDISLTDKSYKMLDDYLSNLRHGSEHELEDNLLCNFNVFNDKHTNLSSKCIERSNVSRNKSEHEVNEHSLGTDREHGCNRQSQEALNLLNFYLNSLDISKLNDLHCTSENSSELNR